MILDAHAASDVGKVREKNEDSWLVDGRRALFAVADGMGGHACGEVASRLAIEAMTGAHRDADELRFRDEYRALQRDGSRVAERSFHQYLLRRAVEAGNTLIHETAAGNAAYHDMGTTIVSARFVGTRVYTASVGDSRIYRWRQGRLKQLTDDHSLANEYVKMKLLRREDVPRFPYRNVIVRALGLSERVQVDSAYVQCRAGDRYLLTSDGLTDLVPDPRIQELLGRSGDARGVAEGLLETALDAGGIDNITVLVVHVRDLAAA